MIRAHVTLVALALAASFVTGCKKEEPPATETPSATPPAPPPPAPVAQAEPPVDPATIPTEEDFEEEASQAISAKNLNEELDRLEKEIQAQ